MGILELIFFMPIMVIFGIVVAILILLLIGALLEVLLR